MNIRPVSDLRNRYPEVEELLKASGEIYLTKNGYGTAVLMDMKRYKELTLKDLPAHAARKNSLKSERGFLSRYADEKLIPLEKNAGRIHAMKKYGGNSNE